MVQLNDLWVLEYSSVQRAYHIDTFEEVIKANRRLFLADHDPKPGYVVLGVADSYDEAHKLRAELEQARASAETKKDEEVIDAEFEVKK